MGPAVGASEPAVGASEPAVAGPSPGHGKSEPAQADGERDSAGQSEVTRTVAARMAELRKQRQWSATALAAEMTNAGVSWDRYIVSNLERGRRANMTVDELLALAEVLGVSHTALLPDALGGEDDPLPGTSRAIDVLARFNEGFAASIHSQSRLDWLEMLVPALELAFSTLKIELFQRDRQALAGTMGGSGRPGADEAVRAEGRRGEACLGDGG